MKQLMFNILVLTKSDKLEKWKNILLNLNLDKISQSEDRLLGCSKIIKIEVLTTLEQKKGYRVHRMIIDRDDIPEKFYQEVLHPLVYPSIEKWQD